MPRIRPYESQVQSPGIIQGRNATGEDFGAGAYAGAAQLGQSVMGMGDFVKRQQEQTDVSDISAKLSELNAKKYIELQEGIRTATPGDQTFSQKFLEKYDQDAASIESGLTTTAGRSFFKKANARLREDLTKSAWSGQAELAGIKAQQDFTSTKNNFSDSLLVDPTNFETKAVLLEEYANHLVQGEDGRPGFLSRASAMDMVAKGKTEMAAATIRGWADKNPEYAQQLLKSNRYDQYLKADQKAALDGDIQQAIRGREIEAERRKKQEKEALEMRQKETQDTFLTQLTKGKLDTKTILNSNLDAFGSGSKKEFLNLLEAHNKGDLNQTDPSVFRDRLNAISRPDGDPNKLVDENALIQDVVNGKLSFEDMGKLRSEMQGRKTEEGKIEGQLKDNFLKTVRGELSGSNDMLGIKDPQGDKNNLAFQTWFFKYYNDQRKAGKTAYQLLDPNSPDYVGKWTTRFKNSPDQIMNNLVSGMQETQGPEAPLPQARQKTPRLPGESAADYLKRTGK